MHKLSQRKQQGFTIIEVLIVLAIAGLILLIVFLAVPAMQRNSRNTQYKNSVGTVLSAINEYSANNNGSLPGYVSIAGNGDIMLGTTSPGVVSGKTQGGYTASLSTTPPGTTETGTFAVAIDRKCNGNVLATAIVKRAVAVLYNVETATGTSPQCTES